MSDSDFLNGPEEFLCPCRRPVLRRTESLEPRAGWWVRMVTYTHEQGACSLLTGAVFNTEEEQA